MSTTFTTTLGAARRNSVETMGPSRSRRVRGAPGTGTESWETGRLLESPNGRELSNFPAATQRMISRAGLRIFHAIPPEPGTWPLAGKADVNRQGQLPWTPCEWRQMWFPGFARRESFPHSEV